MIYDDPLFTARRKLRASADTTASKISALGHSDAGAFIAERNTALGPHLNCRSTPMAAASPTCIPACTGMYALQESVRQMRGMAPAQIPDAKISVCHGVGGMFAASGTIIMANEAP
jgi:hypothetical protein